MIDDRRWPRYMDIATLKQCVSATERTIETWIRTEGFPPPIMRGGKRFWRLADVDRWFDDEARSGAASTDELADRIRHATRTAASQQN